MNIASEWGFSGGIIILSFNTVAILTAIYDILYHLSPKFCPTEYYLGLENYWKSNEKIQQHNNHDLISRLLSHPFGLSPVVDRFSLPQCRFIIINLIISQNSKVAREHCDALMPFLPTATTMNSFELQDELQALQDLESYRIESDHDFSSQDPDPLLEGVVHYSEILNHLLSYCIFIAAVEAVAESSEAIHDPEVFDVYRSVLKHSDMVPGQTMTKLLDSLLSGLQSELDATLRDIELGDQETYAAHKSPLEMYVFLLHWFVTAAEKVKVSEDDPPPPTKPKKARGGKAGGSGRITSRSAAKKANEAWTWEDQIPNTLALTAKVLRQLQTQRLWRTTAERDTFVK